jgi:hypothetical protein
MEKLFACPLQGDRILIVEDDSALAMEVEDQLKREGYDVIDLRCRFRQWLRDGSTAEWFRS